MMSTELSLDLPWIPLEPEPIGELVIRRGRNDVLAYDDGITLQVRVLDPAARASAEVIVADAQAEAGPGRVVLVAGTVPVEWRAVLRQAGLSFIDVAGVAEIAWPRVQVSTRHLTGPAERRTTAIPLQKGHALVVQELLIACQRNPADHYRACRARSGERFHRIPNCRTTGRTGACGA
jgi:hypothetical protein